MASVTQGRSAVHPTHEAARFFSNTYLQPSLLLRDPTTDPKMGKAQRFSTRRSRLINTHRIAHRLHYSDLTPDKTSILGGGMVFNVLYTAWPTGRSRRELARRRCGEQKEEGRQYLM